MIEKTSEMITLWAEHAAQPFQGMAKKDIEKHLTVAIGTAIREGAKVIGGLSDVVFAYKWEEENRISVVTDVRLMTDQMLIIRGKEWAQ